MKKKHIFLFQKYGISTKNEIFICFIDILKTFLGNPIALKSVKAAQKVKVGDDSAKWDHVWNLNSDFGVSIPIYSLLSSLIVEFCRQTRGLEGTKWTGYGSYWVYPI